MIRFLEGLLCGLLIGLVGLEAIKAAVIAVGEAAVFVVQHFS